MKRIMVSVMAGALLLGASTTSFGADGKEGRIQRRKENQQKRIGEGVENGSLTARETGRLERKESKLNKEIREDRKENGGKLTKQEKAQVNRRQNRISKDIYRQKHDGQTQK